MDGFNHAVSVSEVRQGVTPQRVSVFGHYGVDKAPGLVRRTRPGVSNEGIVTNNRCFCVGVWLLGVLRVPPYFKSNIFRVCVKLSADNR